MNNERSSAVLGSADRPDADFWTAGRDDSDIAEVVLLSGGPVRKHLLFEVGCCLSSARRTAEITNRDVFDMNADSVNRM